METVWCADVHAVHFGVVVDFLIRAIERRLDIWVGGLDDLLNESLAFGERRATDGLDDVVGGFLGPGGSEKVFDELLRNRSSGCVGGCLVCASV